MTPQELEAQEKQELQTPEEKTESGTYFIPHTDIHEGEDKIVVSMDMPGVSKEGVEVDLDKDVLTVTGRVDHENYEGFSPTHIEYNVGHFTRRFTVSRELDHDGISASIVDGVLTVTLPKQQKAAARKIAVN